ncbi:hypothetical protein [Flavobacterium stagni]|uniref:Uncharacterized protein n=1 Tax=Flavobacterium stagni TaxID=2506421 RepID=A0A4Q1KC32_9FLAO|nr:hypothetical protein [Flavobacterium stagni]RXR24457.1 hypothetical protein EQG61_03135 [Flavobacterium stagni]
MKKLLLSLLLLAIQSAFSQTLEKTLPIQIDKKADCIEIIDEKNKQLSLFIIDKLNLKLIRINEKLAIIDSISTPKLDNKYNRLFGYSIDSNKYFTYWNSKEKGELGCLTFDFNSKKTTFSTLKFEFEKDVKLYSYHKNGTLNVISCDKNGNNLYIRKITGTEIENHTIDFTGKTFFSYEGKRISLSELFESSNSMQGPFILQLISSETPPSLVLAAKRKKIYIEDTKLKFTFDNYDIGTQVIDVNLNDYTFTQKLISQPYFPKPESMDYYSHPTVSLFFENHYIQLKSSPSELFISIKNEAGDEIKSYKIEQDKEVPFRTSDIIQENGSIKDTRILSKSNQLLRKISNLNPALSLYKSEGNYILVLGGISEAQQNSALYIGSMFGVAGVLIASAITYYSKENFNSYANRKVVYTSSKFDENFNPVNDYVKKTGFDRMRSFISDKTILNPTLFTFNNTLYLGGIIKGENAYSIYSFQD